MKQTEVQLDNVLSHQAVDERVHVVHDPDQNFTVSYIVTDVGPDDLDGLVISAAIARRNPEDNFNRRLGRLISKGRLDCGASSSTFLAQTCTELPTSAAEWRALDAEVCRVLGAWSVRHG